MNSKFVTACNTLPRVPVRKSELDRFKFGKRTYNELFAHSGHAFIFSLDVACGAKPFSMANVLCDLNVKPVADRRMKNLVTEGKPFILCDSRYLPFKDKAFDFVTSYYLIEHMDDPWSLFKELKRVSKHCYIQCPSWFSELVYSEDVHKWIVLKINGKLYVKAINKNRNIIHFSVIFHKLYRLPAWQILHAILDETFHLFTVCYSD
jgi:ubiquinone/menaquinone biosynthesis C-methylase UbiE